MLFTFTWTVWVKSINCTGFSKKKMFTLVNSAQWSMAPLFTGKSARPNLWHDNENWWVLPRKLTFFLLPNTDICGCGWTSPAATITNTHLVIVTLWLWFKKKIIKNILGWGWFDIYIYLVKIIIEIEVE